MSKNKLSIALVVQPDNFRIEYVINDHMAEGYEEYLKDPRGFRRAAQEKSRRMVRNKRKTGTAVLELRNAARFPDAVFVRDAISNVGGRSGKMIIGRMASPMRQGEYEALLPYLNPAHIVLLNEILEGGDFRPTPYTDENGRRVIFIGCGPRTSEKAIKALQGMRGLFRDVRFEALRLSANAFDGTAASLGKADFFHGDTCLYFMRAGAIAVYRPGLTDETWARVQDYAKKHGIRDGQIYEMTKEEAEAFACNIKSNGDILITTRITDTFKAWLEKQGAHVLAHDLEEFRMAGGGPNCLTNEIHDIAQLSALGIRTLLQQNPQFRSLILENVREAIRDKRLPASIMREIVPQRRAFRPRMEPQRIPHTKLRRALG